MHEGLDADPLEQAVKVFIRVNIEQYVPPRSRLDGFSSTISGFLRSLKDDGLQVTAIDWKGRNKS
jgi:hypothetical protein